MNINQVFAHQLIESMKKEGFISHRTPSGICIKKLSEITGTSLQMCRRYINGEVIPDHEKILNLAAALKTSSGSLLFGERNNMDINQKNSITIDEALLRYILNKYSALSLSQKVSAEGSIFLIHLIKQVVEIDVDAHNQTKIVDLAFNSMEASSLLNH